LAEQGIPISRFLSKNIPLYRNRFSRYPSSARVFLKPDGTDYQRESYGASPTWPRR